MSSALVLSPRDEVSSLLKATVPALCQLLAPYGGDPRSRAARMCRIVVDALDRTPALLQCQPASIVASVMQAAELGLEIAGPLGEAYIVPFWDKQLKAKRAQCIPGYRGLIKLAYDEPRIVGIDAEIVYERDGWREVRGSVPVIEHVPLRAKDRGARILAYACIYQREGPCTSAVMGADEVIAIKTDSLAKMKEQWQRDASPWTLHEPEMWKKSALRRVVKLVPLSSALRSALELDAQEYGEPAADRKGRAERLREKLAGVDVPPVVVEQK